MSVQEGREADGRRGLRRRSQAAPRASPASSLGFLSHVVDAATLARAGRLAARWGVPTERVLLANGWVDPEVYARALARSCGADTLARGDIGGLTPAEPGGPRRSLRAGLLRARGSRATVALDATARAPDEVERLLRRLPDGARPALATTRQMRAAIATAFDRQLRLRATRALARRFPLESAADGLVAGQRIAIACAAAALAIGAALDPSTTLRVLAAIGILFFALVVTLRLAALVNLVLALPTRLSRRSPPAATDAELPVYSLLVPLFRERRVLPDLIAALSRLDYPAAKLQVLLVFEEEDAATLAAAKALAPPSRFEFVVVPGFLPRTKPKALNYALPFVRGEFVVVYDAEDRPEPDQLRRALAAFRAGPSDLACVQARLAFYNSRQSWLARQFALEYAALFDGLLPALERLGLPIPLGGTSNHFRVAAVNWLGAWDAYNVTEDADLGMRLARRGYRCRVLDSTTHEEAACDFGNWLRQRTRWMKGFMQTWAVHMRRPARLWRELGPARFLGFQVVIGGIVFSALAHPWFYVLVAVEAANGLLFARPHSLLGWPLWLAGVANVLLGYLASMGLALAALRWRGIGLVGQVPLMPVYWLLISLAAYRAVLHLLTSPFHWEKTEHGLCGPTAGSRVSLS